MYYRPIYLIEWKVHAIVSHKYTLHGLVNDYIPIVLSELESTHINTHDDFVNIHLRKLNVCSREITGEWYDCGGEWSLHITSRVCVWLYFQRWWYIDIRTLRRTFNADNMNDEHGQVVNVWCRLVWTYRNNTIIQAFVARIVHDTVYTDRDKWTRVTNLIFTITWVTEKAQASTRD